MATDTVITTRPDEAALQVVDLEVRYGNVAAVRSVSLRVENGESVALLGANGAGKSSMLRAVSGAVPKRSGTVRVFGQDITGRRPDQILRAGLAHVLEGRHVFPAMTVEENLRMGSGVREDDAVQQDFEMLLDAFPILHEKRGQYAGTLSGGQQQIVVIARALLARPHVLLLDEPSLGLSPKMLEHVVTIVTWARANLDTSVLLVEQHTRLALALAERCYVMAHGRVVLSAPAAELRDDPEVLRLAYLGDQAAVVADRTNRRS